MINDLQIKKMNERPFKDCFFNDVYNIVSQIPFGKVLTYGHIAELMGYPNHSRMVGRALREVPEHLHLPCHRVVNANGRIAPTWPEQAQLLQVEGVTLRTHADGTICVNLRQHLWTLE